MLTTTASWSYLSSRPQFSSKMILKNGTGKMATVASLGNQPPRSRQVETSPSPSARGKAKASRLRPTHGTGTLSASPANSCPLTPLGFLERAATVFGDCPSVVYHDTVFTWSQTHRRCLSLASALVSLGISHGDVVSVLLPNVPAMYEVHFGVPMSGAVLNAMNTRLDARTVAVLLRHSGSKLIFVDPASLQLISDALELLPPGHPAPRVIPVEDPYEELPATSAETLTYERLLEKGDPEFTWARPASEWDPMVLNYTSGTTSGVVHCHRGLFLITLDWLVEWAMPPRPTYLWTLPMFHANGWSFPWGMTMVGGTNVCLRRVNAATVYAAIASRRVTHLCCAPVVLNMLANAPDGVRRPLPGKVRVLTAGAPPPAAVLQRTEAIGFEISHGYGLTETAGLAVSCTWKGEWDKLPASERARLKARQGVRLPCMAEVDIIDGETGRSVPPDGSTMGEIVLRGGSVMLGYLNDDEETKAAISDDGWFYTGDVGVMHPDGYLEIRDRSKDVIINAGENISSVEVESMLYGHPAVNEAAVVARPDELRGETPCAFVSLKEDAVGTVTAADVIAWCRERMAQYMVPRTVVFLTELPKTSTGKIQKYVPRNLAKDMGTARKGDGSISTKV
ncbi:putative acyl-activating enzyme 5, peroxisomal [Dichanthelium oligosanthes]|uniref:Putative acyl-activating enzyme 5, peroxisomal n=1 Tax=Dichanthelium oligosanthes TaxID=888268 RepID=A0A1E5V2M8_9POAL|nr:putative acyl-activating enzyme 5, peroxisomal [Dichanthelium oligosanthes]